MNDSGSTSEEPPRAIGPPWPVLGSIWSALRFSFLVRACHGRGGVRLQDLLQHLDGATDPKDRLLDLDLLGLDLLESALPDLELPLQLVEPCLQGLSLCSH